MPLKITIKYLRGFSKVIHCTNFGMLAIGKISPESRLAGKMNKNVDIIASCWVEDIVEINRPIPKLVNK